MTRFLALAIACCGALLAACTSTGGSTDPAELAEREWTVERLEANDVPADAGLLLRTDAENLSGHTGVNSFHGEARFDANGAFTAGPFALTRRAGPPAAMDRESLLLVCLERADGWRLAGARLELLAGETVLLVATARD